MKGKLHVPLLKSAKRQKGPLGQSVPTYFVPIEAAGLTRGDIKCISYTALHIIRAPNTTYQTQQHQ